jgi:hypothetical protein
MSRDAKPSPDVNVKEVLDPAKALAQPLCASMRSG